MAVTNNANAEIVALRSLGSGPARAQVSEFQRARVIAAALETVDELGYARMTVAQVIRRARVSRKTFYELFSEREDCFLAACEDALARVRTLARETHSSRSGWREGIRAGLEILLMLVEEEPGLARLLIVEALAAGEKVLARRAEVMDELADVIDHGRLARDFEYPPALAGQAVAAGALAVIHDHLVRGSREPPTDLLGPLMCMITMPYLGARIARSELDRPAARSSRRRRRRRQASDTAPLGGLDLRLTYRTVRVLGVMASRPGASNREIAEGAGIVDQGQVSKLLSRLARAGLAENVESGREKGTVNSWHLTARGAQLERASRPLNDRR